MQYLIDRSVSKGNSMQVTLQALKVLHRYSDVIKKTKGEDVEYSVRQIKTYTLDSFDPYSLIPEEEMKEMKRRQYVLLHTVNPLNSEKEADCHNSNSKSDECIRLTSSPTEYEYIMLQKHGQFKWKRMKEESALL